MTDAVSDQEERSREIADATRRYLTALNTGRVAVTFGVATRMTERGIQPPWASWPLVLFVVGLE